jgi:hypothetical protein
MIRTAITTLLPIGAIACALVWTLALRTPDRVAPAPAAVTCSEPAAAPPPPPPATTRPEPESGHVLGRVVDIFEAVDVPHPTGVTTFSLPQRTGDAALDVGDGVAVRTLCDDHGCIDGLFEHGKTLIAPRREPDEQFDRGTPFELERVVQVVDRSDDKLSVYVATSEYSGGAHANNALGCRTYSRATGRRLRLRDVMPPRSAALVLAKVRVLFDPIRGLEETGELLPEIRVSAEDVDDRNFRVEQRVGRDHVVLCVSSDYAGLLEIRVDALPVDFLLR